MNSYDLIIFKSHSVSGEVTHPASDLSREWGREAIIYKTSWSWIAKALDWKPRPSVTLRTKGWFNMTSMSSTRFRNTLVWATWDSRTWLNVEPKISLHRFVGKPYTLRNAAHLSFLKWIFTLPRPLAVPQSQVRESAERLSKMRFKLVGAHGLGLLS